MVLKWLVACVALLFTIKVNASWESAITDQALKTCIQQTLKKDGLTSEQLTTLKCHSKKIEQLDGLEQFKNLTSLSLFNNKIETANVSALSKLSTLNIAKLESAHLFDNQMEDLDIVPLVNLTFMDVKQNPMPDELYDFFDEQEGVVISHDGNADDWK
jgi:Leucine-rich repeat (LRR) protein